MTKKSFIILGILLSPILYIGAMLALGYEFAGTPEKLATKLIAEDRSAKDCFRFRTLDIGPRPTTYELQMRCVYVYASETKDASACEFLLPSEYGLSCLSEVGGGELSKGEECTTMREYVGCSV